MAKIMKASLMLTIVVGFMACFSCDKLRPKSDDERVVPVRVVEVDSLSSQSAVAALSEYVGTVEESSSTQLSFPVNGQVKAVYVREGQHVSAGQLLAELDNANAVSSFQAAQATLRQAQDGYDRAKSVHEKGSLPDVKWIEIQTKLSQAQSLYDIAKKNVDQCKLYAPVSGTVSDKNLEVGTSLAPYQPVMRLLNMGGMYVRVSIPEADVSRVKRGTKAFVEVPALDGADFEGVVEERKVSADALSHSYMARIRLRGKNGVELLPGMVCKVSLGGRETTPGCLLPNRAVQLDNNGNRFVWVVRDSTAQPVEVTIRDLNAHGVVVTSGLRCGEQVIVDGALKVSTGTKVVIR